MINLNTLFLNNPISSWLKALLLGLVVWLVLSFIRKFILKKTSQSGREIGMLHQLSLEFKGPTIFALAVAAMTVFLNVSEGVSDVLRIIYISVAGFQIGSWLTSVLESSLQKQFSAIPEEDSSKRSSLKTVGTFFKIFIWLVIILVILDNIPNLDIASMITGLGIGGIAIGLAAQNFIGDLLSSLTISLDKPFVVGDSIQVGEFTGTVDHIGIKSTRIRSLNGEELIISNSDLLSSCVQNYEQMQERRVVFILRLGYDTPAEALRRIPEILQEEIDQQENVRFSRAHFKEYGEVALIYEVVYFVTSPKYIDHVEAQNAINLAIFSRFEQEQIQLSSINQRVLVGLSQNDSTELRNTIS